MNGDPTKKAYRQAARQTRKTARVTARDIRNEGRTVAKGARMVASGTRLANRVAKKSSSEVSRMRKIGQVGRGGPSKSLRYRAMDAEVKKSTGADMRDNPRKYMSGAKVSRGAKRTASSSPVKTGKGTYGRVNRFGNPTRRRN